MVIKREKLHGMLLIINLLISILAFSTLMTDFVSAEEDLYHYTNEKGISVFGTPGSIYEVSDPTGKTISIRIPKDVNEKGMKLWKENKKNPSNTQKPAASSTLATLLGLQKGSYTDAIVSGGQWAAIVYISIKTFGSMLGLEKGKVDAASIAFSMGVATGKGLYSLLGKQGAWETGSLNKFFTMGGKLGAGQAAFVWGGIATFKLLLVKFINSNYPIMVTKW